MAEKGITQIFDTRSGCKIIKQNMPGRSDFKWFYRHVVVYIVASP